MWRYLMNGGTSKFTASLALTLVGLTALTLLFPTAAWAQESEEQAEPQLPALQLQRFRPAPGAADYLTVFGTGVAPHLQWNAGVFFNYADDPLQLGAVNAPERRTVAYQGQMDLMGSIGLFDVLEVGLVLPWTVLQRSDELRPLLPASSESRNDLRRSALNDWRLMGKYQVVSLAEADFGLAFQVGLNLPFANSNALTSDGGFGAETSVIGEYVFYETIRAAANLGFRYRPGQRIIRQNVIGNEVTWGLAVHAPLFTERLDAIGEIAGAIGVERRPEHLSGVAAGEVPMEFKAALRYLLVDDWSLTGGFGTGLTDGLGSPDWRFFIGVSGQWVTGGWWWVDYRQPGFRAEIDPCEDRYRDQTGRRLRFDPADCPEIERDEGLSDEERIALLDRTPTGPTERRLLPPREPEVEEEEEDRGSAIFRHGAIIVTEQVHFETGSSNILEDSFAFLEDVARLIRDYDEIRLVRIEGHTDSVGAAQMNLRLSQERAESVRQYLIGTGIDAGRLEAVGYGQAQPIADNDTAEGRARNRRVEFNILEMAGSGGGI